MGLVVVFLIIFGVVTLIPKLFMKELEFSYRFIISSAIFVPFFYKMMIELWESYQVLGFYIINAGIIGMWLFEGVVSFAKNVK